MNTPKIKENTHALDGGDFILGESPNNPFARIACKTRKLTPTVCDGTCLGCRKDRDIFLRTEPQRLMGGDILVAGGDPDYEHIPLEEYATQVQEKVQKLEMSKKEILEYRKNSHILTEKVNERMRVLMLQVQSPEPSSTLQ